MIQRRGRDLKTYTTFNEWVFFSSSFPLSSFSSYESEISKLSIIFLGNSSVVGELHGLALELVRNHAHVLLRKKKKGK